MEYLTADEIIASYILLGFSMNSMYYLLSTSRVFVFSSYLAHVQW